METDFKLLNKDGQITFSKNEDGICVNVFGSNHYNKFNITKKQWVYLYHWLEDDLPQNDTDNIDYPEWDY